MNSTINIKRDKRKWIGLVIIGLIIILFIVEKLITRIDSFSAEFFQNQFLLWALWNICFILILVLIFLYGRYLRSLYIEKKRKVLGHKFKVKLVVSFLAIALIPSVLLVLSGVNLINRVIEGWFKTPVEDVLSNASKVSDKYYSNLKSHTKSLALSMSDRIMSKGLWSSRYKTSLEKFLAEKLGEYKLEYIMIKLGERVLSFSEQEDMKYPIITPEIEQQVMQDKSVVEMVQFRGGHLIRAIVPVHDSVGSILGYLVVSNYMEPDVAREAWLAKVSYNKYLELSRLEKPIKRYYFNLFLMITLLILFGVSWIGFTLAKEITIPIQLLAEGTRRISQGDYNYRISFESGDELGMLVESFNKMTDEIRISKEAIERTNIELTNSNISLEERRRYIETILNTITTGVITIDDNNYISTINPAACKILRLPVSIKAGQEYKEFFTKNGLGKVLEAMEPYLSKRRAAMKEIEVSINRRIKHLALQLSPLQTKDDVMSGMVIVIDDLTDMVKAQKLATWQEIARRIAHEINNPLTPIQLSAEHIKKKISENEGYMKTVLMKDANNIMEGVTTLKALVSEFTRFARLPAMNKKEMDLHATITNAINMYDGLLRDIKVEFKFDNSVPLINGDEQQLKRVFINLIENSLEAMNNNGKISIATVYDPDNAIVRIEISDTGKGIPLEERDKVFLPYYSTKKRGMGLGLAIVARIISDHSGYIRIEDNEPTGAKFQIEIPIN